MKVVKRDAYLNIRIPKIIKAKYNTMASKNRKTLSDIINEVLEKGLEDYENSN